MRLACLMVVMIAVACGGRTTGDGSGDGSGDDGSDDGGDGGDDDGSGDDGSGADGSGDDGSGDSCETFKGPDDVGPAVAVVVENGGDTDIYIREVVGCTTVEPWQLAGPDGEGAKRWRLDFCEFSCDVAVEGQCACPGACPQDTLVRIEPGGSYPTEWQGSVFVPDTLPAECTDEFCSSDCLREIQATEGAYEITVAGTDTPSCQPEPCECISDGDGYCLVGGQFDGAPVEAAAAFDYGPDPMVVKLTF